MVRFFKNGMLFMNLGRMVVNFYSKTMDEYKVAKKRVDTIWIDVVTRFNINSRAIPINNNNKRLNNTNFQLSLYEYRYMIDSSVWTQKTYIYRYVFWIFELIWNVLQCRAVSVKSVFFSLLFAVQKSLAFFSPIHTWKSANSSNSENCFWLLERQLPLKWQSKTVSRWKCTIFFLFLFKKVRPRVYVSRTKWTSNETHNKCE